MNASGASFSNFFSIFFNFFQFSIESTSNKLDANERRDKGIEPPLLVMILLLAIFFEIGRKIKNIFRNSTRLKEALSLVISIVSLYISHHKYFRATSMNGTHE